MCADRTCQPGRINSVWSAPINSFSLTRLPPPLRLRNRRWQETSGRSKLAFGSDWSELRVTLACVSASAGTESGEEPTWPVLNSIHNPYVGSPLPRDGRSNFHSVTFEPFVALQKLGKCSMGTEDTNRYKTQSGDSCETWLLLRYLTLFFKPNYLSRFERWCAIQWHIVLIQYEVNTGPVPAKPIQFQYIFLNYSEFKDF